MDCILGMDIGGTNTSVGIFDVKLRQIISFKHSTKELHPYESIRKAATEAKKRSLRIIAAGIAVAGPIQKETVHLTNAGISLSSNSFRKILKIRKVALLNDFEAIAYGLNTLKKNECVALTRNKVAKNGVKVVLGAGTGLGKAVLYFDEKVNGYVPLPAEEGHTSLAVSTKGEFALLESIRKKKKGDVVWEDVLSGRGIAAVHGFLQQKMGVRGKAAQEIADAQDKASTIALYRKTNAVCRETFRVVSTIYARFIRNSMLQSLPYGGVYVAGGIAILNPGMLSSKEFKKELYKKAVYSGIVKKIPLFVFSSPAIGLRGAAYYARKEFLSQ